MPFYPFSFESQIDEFGVGKSRKIWYRVLFLPKDIAESLPFKKYPRLRVEGEIADVPISNAFIPTGDGRYYVIVAPKILKTAEVKVGDTVEMRFKIADQDHVDVPEALQQAIDKSAEINANWKKLTPGKQRMLAQHVLSAKTQSTEFKRVAEAIESLEHFNADLRAWRRAKKANNI